MRFLIQLPPGQNCALPCTGLRALRGRFCRTGYDEFHTHTIHWNVAPSHLDPSPPYLSDVDFFCLFSVRMIPRLIVLTLDIILQILQGCFICPQKYLLSTIGIQGTGLGAKGAKP